VVYVQIVEQVYVKESYMIEIKILKEAGYIEALYGMGLSHGVTAELDPMSLDQPENRKIIDKLVTISKKLYVKDGGHNKFLESIQIWLSIKAPRYWWVDLDTYRVGISKQSESTNHTIAKRALTKKDFNESDISNEFLQELNDLIEQYKLTKDKSYFYQLKNRLPEGFMQKRIACLNYKGLRNIIKQRYNHILTEFYDFSIYIIENVEHKEYFEDLKDILKIKDVLQ